MSVTYWILWLLFTVANVALLLGTIWAWRRMSEDYNAFVEAVERYYGGAS